MARIPTLPSLEIIRGLKGILDFYVWRGLPCVRAWPRWRPARQTDASLTAALTFGAIVKAYALLANLALQAYREDALDQPRTARDIMVTGVYGNLHEASMSDFLDALIIIRDGVVALTDLLHALDSVDTDEIVVNVDQSVLPPLAATTTNQATAITALHKLDDLQDALESKALDRLLVRGMDQVFSFKSVLLSRHVTTLDGNNGYAHSHTPASGLIWLVTSALAYNDTRATTEHRYYLVHDAAYGGFYTDKHAIATAERTSWSGLKCLDPGDTITIQMLGGLAADTVILDLTGYTMTLET